jgi:hypothetical protein
VCCIRGIGPVPPRPELTFHKVPLLDDHLYRAVPLAGRIIVDLADV